ncbi:MAG: hypothetical protein Q7S21_05405 [archaeon]|nr:hypothetical protein [archaeon]
MPILSPDTNIFIKSYLAANEKEKMKYLLIIIKDCKDSRSVVVNSVKNEFYKLIDTAHTIIEAVVFNIESGKKLNDAINSIDADTSLFNIENIKKGLPILGFETMDIENDKEKRGKFLHKISETFNEIKENFAHNCNKNFLIDKQKNEEVNAIKQKLQANFDTINTKFNYQNHEKKPIHEEDEEHWIRTALFNKNEKMIFLTVDYFGVGKETEIANQIKKEVEKVINQNLKTNFEINFK